MVDLRRVVIIFIIAVLFAVLANATIQAISPSPQYDDYCKNRFVPEKPMQDNNSCPDYDQPSQEELDQCANQGGSPEYDRDGNGCAIAYAGCNMCQQEYQDAQEKYNLIVFIISAILAFVAIMIGLYLPMERSISEWIATGFLLGGLITLFTGTIRYYQYMGRYVKPIIILVELIVIIYLAYKKLDDHEPKKRK